jgi:hypothetical protein
MVGIAEQVREELDNARQVLSRIDALVGELDKESEAAEKRLKGEEEGASSGAD